MMPKQYFPAAGSLITRKLAVEFMATLTDARSEGLEFTAALAAAAHECGITRTEARALHDRLKRQPIDAHTAIQHRRKAAWRAACKTSCLSIRKSHAAAA